MPTRSGTPFGTLISAADLAAHVADPDWLVVDCRFELGETRQRRARVRRRAHSACNLCPSRPGPGRPDHAGDRTSSAAAAGDIRGHARQLGHDASDTGRRLRRRQCGVRSATVVAAALGRALTRSQCSTADSKHGSPPDCLPRRRCHAAAPATSWHARIATCGTTRAKSPSACSAPTGVCSTRARRSASPARSSRSIRSPATCRARAIIRSRPISGATHASRPRRNCERVSRSRKPASTDDHTIVMCGSGVTACNLLLAMEHAGKRGARLYAGSWSEWIRDPSRGVEKDGSG